MAIFISIVLIILSFVFLLARFGGEEFVLIVRKCKVPLVQEAELIIKKLRKVVEDLTIPGLPKITCSIGVGFPDDVKNRQEILKEADENMYLAKENGRNRAYIIKNPLGKASENGIARFVSVCVVKVLKMVYIEKNDKEEFAVKLKLTVNFAKIFIERASVEHAR